MSLNGHAHVTKRVIIDVNSIVSGQNSDILTSMIAKLLASWQLSDLSRGSLLTVPV